MGVESNNGLGLEAWRTSEIKADAGYVAEILIDGDHILTPNPFKSTDSAALVIHSKAYRHGAVARGFVGNANVEATQRPAQIIVAIFWIYPGTA